MISLRNITNKKTLNAIQKYNITEEHLNSFQSLEELKKYIRNCCSSSWNEKHRQYFKERYLLNPEIKERCKNYMRLKYTIEKMEKPKKEKKTKSKNIAAAVEDEKLEKIQKSPRGRKPVYKYPLPYHLHIKVFREEYK